MHICSIVTSFTYGGAETIVANLSDAFVQANAQSTILTLSHAHQVGNCPDMERTIMDRITAGGGAARSLGLTNRRNIIAGAMALRKFLAVEKPDVIHAHTAQVLPMLWLARPAAPIFLTHHNSQFSFPPALFMLFNRIVDGYVAISSGCADLLKAYARKPITIIYNIAGAGYDITSPRHAPTEAPSILCVGAISAQKDYETLIRATALLRNRLSARHRELRIKVAGGGAQIDSLRTLAQAQGIGDVIAFLGPRDDVPDLLAQAHIFVNCSLYEGLPVAVIEAMKAALPVVATNVAGNCELVRHGETGVLVPPQNPEELASAIAGLLNDAPSYEAMSRAARAASAQYSLSASAAAHIQMYRAALDHALHPGQADHARAENTVLPALLADERP